jgi:RNA polymerase sigma factor (sigma-70 family)
MMNQTTMHREILSLMPAIRRTIKSALRKSCFQGSDHLDECMSSVMVQVFEYAVRTFDADKGSAYSHFTFFARSRAINWMRLAHHRFETRYPDVTDDDGETVSLIDLTASDVDDISRVMESGRIRKAITALRPRQRALLEAFERLGCWSEAGREIGVSAPTASRMKAQIAERLK